MSALIPSLIPPAPDGGSAFVPLPSTDSSSLYDIALNGTGFVFANTTENPMVRETAPYLKQQLDTAADPGEQTLTTWWIKSQESFHGGAGALNLEPAFPSQFDHIRFDSCKNVDVFTPGRVTRLPDTTVLNTDNVTQLVAATTGGVDAIAYLTGGTAKLLIDPLGTWTTAPFTGVTGVLALATDGATIYAATSTGVYRLDMTNVATATLLATYPVAATTPVALGWTKARLMLGVNGAVYELDVTATGVTLGASQLRFQHPASGWVWRCFSDGRQAIMAAGDVGGQSTITQFTIDNSTGAPVLTVAGEVTAMPVGERILSMIAYGGTFLIVGTTSGVRVGTYNVFTGAFTYGPLELLPTDPKIPAVALAQRDRFIFVAGLAYDEGGLLRLDMGTQIDQAGRVAWAPDLIAPVATATAATAVATLCVSGRVVLAIPGTGLLLEGSGPGTGREAWLRTSRIRYNTTEPKLFKWCRVRGDLSAAEIEVTATTPTTTQMLGTVGFSAADPDELRLPDGRLEWLQLTFSLLGAAGIFTAYSTRALPGIRKQRHLEFVVAIADRETTKSGQRTADTLSARQHLSVLEALDAANDECLLQEFTPNGVVATRVQVERVTFTEVGRPSNRSDIGGTATILLLTLES